MKTLDETEIQALRGKGKVVSEDGSPIKLHVPPPVKTGSPKDKFTEVLINILAQVRENGAGHNMAIHEFAMAIKGIDEKTRSKPKEWNLQVTKRNRNGDIETVNIKAVI